MAVAVDVPLLSSYSSLSGPAIQSLIDTPSPDLVNSFLRNLVPKIEEHNRLKSDRLRLDVEHESAVRNAEAQARQLKTQAEAATREAEQLKTQADNSESARSDLQQRIEDLQSSTSTSSNQTQALQSQIDRLEKSNRDTLSLLDSKSTAHDKLAQELTAQHQKAVGSRREVSNLEERIQGLENKLSTAKFRESQLESEVERLKRSNDWYESELNTKNSEHTKFRKEKNAKIAELQRAFEDATQSVESLQRTESTLRRRLDEVGEKADEAFSKIQQLQEDAAKREEDFRLERDRLNRLTDLRQQSAETSRRRLEEVEQQLEQTRDDAANEIGEFQSELEGERQGRETSERRIEQLESELQQLQAELDNAPKQQAPATPKSRMNGRGPSTPGNGRSPAPFSPGPAHSRAANFTQLLSEHNDLKAELDQERRAHAALRQTFDEMVTELQEKEPELQQAQEDRDHFEGEITQLSGLLEEARQERETAKKDARKQRSLADNSEHRVRNLEQQLRDQSAQIKFLLVEQQIREQGDSLDPAQREQLYETARAMDREALEGMSDTGKLISKELIIFKDVFDLQEKNTQLTKIVRELGEQREQEEAKAKNAEQHSDDLEQLNGRVKRYQDELTTLRTQLASYVQERDMFRRMVAHRGKIPADADMESMFGASVNGTGTPRTPGNRGAPTPDPEQSAVSKDLADHVKLLRELQAHFDAYKHETAQDYRSAKDQVDSLSKEKNQLQSEVIRANSQVTLGQERLQMLQSNYELLKSENGEIQKRSNSMHEAAARQDMRTQQVADDLVQAQGIAEGLRNESANLKAEKELWRRVETRLKEDNHGLTDEKGRLNRIIADTQNLAHERELSDSEARRKLQAQVDSMDAELRDLRRKFEEEIENSKNATLRKEYEQEQSRTRIDDLVKSLGNTKEELATAKTTRDQLQSRVDELKIELRSAENRYQALQPRSTPRPPTDMDESNDADDGLDHEQQLGMELVEVKRELEIAKTELESAKTQVEEYRAVAESSEDQLNSVNETYQQYRDDADKVATESEEKIKDLEQRVQDMSSELFTANEQFTQMRATAADHDTRLNQQREAFETQLSQVKDECDRYKETASYHQQDLKAQAEVAQQAQQSYETELMQHAKATETLKKIRDEFSDVKLQLSQSRADADAARMTLSQNEDSWSNSKEQYEKELSDLKTRRDEVVDQNTLLHNQLQSFSGQISALQHRHSTPSGDQAADNSPSSGDTKLQEVINYLRREKEIVDVQYELSGQEVRRLKQQLDYTTTQLEESRSRLEQERQKQADRESGATSHNKLMETLNELNVFRESSVTLRNENRRAQEQVAAKTRDNEQLLAQVQPLQTSVRELEGNLDAAQKEKSLAEAHSNGLQQRISNILQKYDRIDPAELEALKEQITRLEAERDELNAKAGPLQERIDGFAEELRQAQETGGREMKEKLAAQFKTRSQTLSAQIKVKEKENEDMKKDLDRVHEEFLAAQQARDEAVAQSEATVARNETQTASDGAEAAQSSAEEGQVDEDDVSKPAQEELQTRLQTAENLTQERLQELEASKNDLVAAQSKIADMEKQINDQLSQLTTLNTELTQLREQSVGAPQDSHLEKLQQDLAAAQSELELLRTQASNAQEQPTAASAEAGSSVERIEQQVETRRKELQDAHDAKMKELETQSTNRVENMKKQLNTKLSENKQRNEAALQDLRQQLEEARKAPAPAPESASDTPGSAAASIDAPAAPSGSENAFNNDSTPKVKTEGPGGTSELTREQIQKLVSTNPDLKAILAKNIRARIETEQKQSAAKLAELQATAEKELKEKIDELNEKATKAKEQAVLMEGKKHSVKASIAENRSKTYQAKWDFVAKAAEDTPERAVREVWTLAKDVKGQPAPAPVQTNAPPAGPSAPSPRPKPEAPQRKPSQAQQATPTTSSPSAPKAPAPTQPRASASPKPEQQSPQQQAQQALQQSPQQASQTGQQPPSGPAQTQNQSITAPTAPTQSTPIGPSQTTNAATRAPSQGLAGPSGSGIPRGGGTIRGRGRGGPTQSGLPRGGNSGVNIRGRGTMLGQQGAKRPREDSQGGGGEGGNKKPRGGGG